VFLGQPLPLLGAVAAVLCALTVLATAMIYAQIRAVPRWHHWTTPAVFLAAAASGGALLAGLGGVAAGALVVLAAAMALHWAAGDGRRRQPGSTPETATGLGFLGRVRLLAPPHTGTNYLLREMVHVVGRRHAARLRVLALGLGVAVPLALLAVPGGGWPLALAAAVVHAVGMAAARWLFFAEAEHAVGLYYGRR
jgi:DMSO reductase anchor subunit